MSTSDRKIIIVSESEDDGMILIRYFIGLVIVLAVVMLLIAGWALYKETEERPPAGEDYRQQLIRYEADPAWRAEWKRLHKKHGNPGVVIYEPGLDPYYIDAQGRKCRFM